ncbi:unnamed protein product [Alternaria alternata]
MAQAMTANDAAPMATRQAGPTAGVARAAPAISGGEEVLLASGSPGRPEDDVTTTVVVTDAVGEAEGAVVSPGGAMSVEDAGGVTLTVHCSEAEETADSMGGWRIRRLARLRNALGDGDGSSHGGSRRADGLEKVVNLCGVKRVEQILTVRSDDSQDQLQQ